MKLKVIRETCPIKVLGEYDVIDWVGGEERIVFIDDKRVPPGLARIILLGLDTACKEWLDQVEFEIGFEMQRNHHE